MTAKIDTQAPAIGMTTGIDFGTGKDATMLTLVIDGKLHHASTDGPWGQAILALLAERDLSAAREAAAAQAMREAAADEACYACGSQDSIRILPLPDTTALDRLIGERVREAVEAEREAIRQAIDALPRVYPENRTNGEAVMVERKDGGYLRLMQVLYAIAARGSKEGRDGTT